MVKLEEQTENNRDRIESMSNVIVICVNYHNEQETITCVNSILQQENSDLLRVIVVNNNEGVPRESGLSELAKEEQQVRILHPGQNLGYFGAASWGLQQYLANASLPDWVIVSNSDIDLPKQDFFSRLFSFYQTEDYAIIAPKIRSSLSGKDQNPFMIQRPNSKRMKSYKWIFRYYPIMIAYQLLALCRTKFHSAALLSRTRFRKKTRNERDRRQIIYAPHGSFILFHKSYFDAGGTLEYGAFLFGEEIFLAETVRNLGLRIVYDPRLEVRHRDHSTTGIIRNRELAKYQWKAAVYCADTFFGSRNR